MKSESDCRKEEEGEVTRLRKERWHAAGIAMALRPLLSWRQEIGGEVIGSSQYMLNGKYRFAAPVDT